jgi:hypothetical protein
MKQFMGNQFLIWPLDRTGVACRQNDGGLTCVGSPRFFAAGGMRQRDRADIGQVKVAERLIEQLDGSTHGIAAGGGPVADFGRDKLEVGIDARIPIRLHAGLPIKATHLVDESVASSKRLASLISRGEAKLDSAGKDMIRLLRLRLLGGSAAAGHEPNRYQANQMQSWHRFSLTSTGPQSPGERWAGLRTGASTVRWRNYGQTLAAMPAEDTLK